ncbi:hypothetical protein X975_03617, partial [Stegodyphus mimosarum]
MSSKSNNTSVPKDVMDYLVVQNRPYSVIDIFNNLHKDHSKAAIMKALEQLTAAGKIKEKTYGKQKIYFVDQSELPVAQDSDLKQMDAQISNLGLTLSEIQRMIKNAENHLATLNKSLTTEEAEAELNAVQKEIPLLKEKLSALESNSNHVRPEEREALHKDKIKYSKEWQKRKRLANDMIDAILEGYPKSKKELLEELSVETDEDG